MGAHRISKNLQTLMNLSSEHFNITNSQCLISLLCDQCKEVPSGDSTAVLMLCCTRAWYLFCPVIIPIMPPEIPQSQTVFRISTTRIVSKSICSFTQSDSGGKVRLISAVAFLRPYGCNEATGEGSRTCPPGDCFKLVTDRPRLM